MRAKWSLHVQRCSTSEYYVIVASTVKVWLLLGHLVGPSNETSYQPRLARSSQVLRLSLPLKSPWQGKLCQVAQDSGTSKEMATFCLPELNNHLPLPKPPLKQQVCDCQTLGR